jgi:hypothetical protein
MCWSQSSTRPISLAANSANALDWFLRQSFEQATDIPLQRLAQILHGSFGMLYDAV